MVGEQLKIFRKRINFHFKARTSRNTFLYRDIYILELKSHDCVAYGEAGPLHLLSIDDVPNYETKLIEYCQQYINDKLNWNHLNAFPSIQFALETLNLDFQNGGNRLIFNCPWLHGTPTKINGLVWMDTPQRMLSQAIEKIEQGFTCIKLKIGAHPFHEELNMLQYLRSHYSNEALEIRVDANGAFHPEYALNNLAALGKMKVHSIEQPIAPGHWKEMARICEESKVPIALDEELIGIDVFSEGADLLDTIKPHYLILKPNLIGGFRKCDAWIALAEERNIAWWATSALESNIGLNAISQWTSSKMPSLPQGLGTGSLYNNNIASPLVVETESLRYDENRDWSFDEFLMDAKLIAEF